jgi:cytochrome c-type biogenesis protein CcmH/NrfG
LIWLVLVAGVIVAGGTWLVAKSTPTRLVVLALGLTGVGAYWFIGQPGMSDRPLEVRLAEIEQMIRKSPERLNEKEAIAIAERRARQQPTDPTPHMMIARMYESLAQRAQAEGMRLVQGGDEPAAAAQAAAMQESLLKAEEAFTESLRRDPSNAEVIAELADLRFKTTGEVDARTTRLYRAAFQANPDRFRYGYLAGIGLWLQGQKAEAEALWADIDKRAPAEGPERGMFAALRQMFGIDSPAIPTTPPRAPSQK